MNDDRFDEVFESIEAEPDLQDPVFFAAAESRTEYDEDIFALDYTAMASDDYDNRDDERTSMSHYTDDFDPDSIYQPRESIITQAGTIQYLYDDEKDVAEEDYMFLQDEDDGVEDVFATYESAAEHEEEKRAEVYDGETGDVRSGEVHFEEFGYENEEIASFESNKGEDYDAEQFLDNDNDFLEEEDILIEEDPSEQQFESFEHGFSDETPRGLGVYEALGEDLEEEYSEDLDNSGDFADVFDSPEDADEDDNGSAPFFATDEDIEAMEQEEDDGVDDPFYVGPTNEDAGSDLNFDIDEELRFSHGVSTGPNRLMQTALILIGLALTSLLSIVIFAPKMVEPFLPKEVLAMLAVAPEEDPFWGMQIGTPGDPVVPGQAAPNQALGEKDSLKSDSKAAKIGQETSNLAVGGGGESPKSKEEESKLEVSDLKSGQDSPSEIATLPGQVNDSKEKSLAPNDDERVSIVPDSAKGNENSISNEGTSATDLKKNAEGAPVKLTEKNKVSNPVGEKRDAKANFEVKEKRNDVSIVVKATSPIKPSTLTNAKSEVKPIPLLHNHVTKGVNYPYEVQIAAAGNAATGDSLAKLVQSQGFSAMVYKIKVNGRYYHRVVIRTPSREEAESIGRQLFSKGIVKEKPFVRKVP